MTVAETWNSQSPCTKRVISGLGLGGALGLSIGTCWGTYEAFKYKVPGLFKIRHIGQTSIQTAAVFSIFLGAGSLVQCGRS